MTALQLPEAIIRERQNNPTGFTLWAADSLPHASVISLTNRLFWENALDLRQNAPGTLATVSARGAGPNRTAVIWEGLNLQSPMNGVIDVSLVPIWPGDQLAVQQGGNSASLGSGAMGGSVLLASAPRQSKNGWQGALGMEAGSFGKKMGQGHAAYQTGSLNSRIRAAWQTAENNFPIEKTGLDGKVFTTTQDHNFTEKTDVQQYNFWKINAKNDIRTAAWIQHAFRQIPPTLTESVSDTWQRDRSARAIATWEHKPRPNASLQTRLAWQDEYIAFFFAGKTEESRAQSALLNTEWVGKLQQQGVLRLGGSAQYVRAKSDGYKTKNSWYGQTRLASYALGEYLLGGQTKLSLLLRQEWITPQTAPFTWTLGWEIPLWKAGRIHGHWSRNFNLPTFNDRFWETLDNKVLVAEKGYSADMGWRYKNQRFTTEITGFHLVLDDWILWLPGQDGIFRPGNLRKVRSQGIELAGSVAGHISKLNWRLKGRYQLSKTVNTAVYGGSEAILGKQLPYTPNAIAGGGIWLAWASFSGAYLHQYSGRRFTTSDNQYRLPGYQTGTLMFQYNIGRERFWHWSDTLLLDVTLENIWNTNYQSLANRPMPGRNWRVGAVFGW